MSQIHLYRLEQCDHTKNINPTYLGEQAYQMHLR